MNDLYLNTGLVQISAILVLCVPSIPACCSITQPCCVWPGRTAQNFLCARALQRGLFQCCSTTTRTVGHGPGPAQRGPGQIWHASALDDLSHPHEPRTTPPTDHSPSPSPMASFKRARSPPPFDASPSSSQPSSPTIKAARTSATPPPHGPSTSATAGGTTSGPILCTLPPTCNPPHRPTTLADTRDLEAHYARYHAHVCEQRGCGCVFPDARLLELVSVVISLAGAVMCGVRRAA